MEDLVHTCIPLLKSFGKKYRAYVDKKCNGFEKDTPLVTLSEADLCLLNSFKNRINKILLSKENISEQINKTMCLFKKCIKKVDLSDDKNQRLLFEQLREFLNHIGFVLRKNSKYVFNSLSSNKIEYFNEKSIGEKIDDIIPKDNYLDNPNYWSSCWHYALLFKDFFDQLKSVGLNISNYLFIEKTDSADQDHLGLVVTFQGENFLVDSFSDVEKKTTIQSMKNLPKIYFQRMYSLSDVSNEDIEQDNIDFVIENYLSSDSLYYKIPIGTTDDLLKVLSSITNKKGCLFLGRLQKKNILDLFIGTFFNIFSDRISFAHTFDYYFKKILMKKV